MNLKEVMQREASSVFMNEDEFAEEIVIEGIPTSAVCDWSVVPEGEHLYGSPDDTWGVNVVHAEINLAENIIPQPEIGQEIDVNGLFWQVRTASAQDGVLNLKLFRNVA